MHNTTPVLCSDKGFQKEERKKKKKKKKKGAFMMIYSLDIITRFYLDLMMLLTIT
jgi:hypothetical protein